MMFGIFAENTPTFIDEELVLPSRIIIDDFKESLYIPISYWSLEDYKKSWRKSIKEGLQKKNHAALAVSMHEPENTNFVFIWALYFIGNTAHIQNKVLFIEEHPNFTIDSINDCIRPRETHNEDGMKISEWNTDIKSILDFYNTLNH